MAGSLPKIQPLHNFHSTNGGATLELPQDFAFALSVVFVRVERVVARGLLDDDHEALFKPQLHFTT